jgi:hypothetical protein
MKVEEGYYFEMCSGVCPYHPANIISGCHGNGLQEI